MTALRSSNSSGQPQLHMVIEPENKFRFRYESDRGSHGGIQGKKCGTVQEKAKKLFPTVKLENYNSKKRVCIRVSLYTDDREQHVLQLVGKHVRNGMCYEDLDDKHFTAKFTNLIIRAVKKEDAHKILMNRKILCLGSSISETAKKQLESEVKERAKKILNSAVLCFEAFSHDNPYVPICEPLYSKSISNQKSSLKILRISHCSGSCMGGEDVIILCDKVKKDAIKVLFFERDDDDSIIWEREAKFSPANVHYQVAIAFKTPPYKENAERSVFVCLCQNDERSESVDFLYTANDDVPLKKRKLSVPAELGNSSLIQVLNALSPGSSSYESLENNDYLNSCGFVGSSDDLNAMLSRGVDAFGPDDTSNLLRLDDTSNLQAINFDLPEDTLINANNQDSTEYSSPPHSALNVYNQVIELPKFEPSESKLCEISSNEDSESDEDFVSKRFNLYDTNVQMNRAYTQSDINYMQPDCTSHVTSYDPDEVHNQCAMFLLLEDMPEHLSESLHELSIYGDRNEDKDTDGNVYGQVDKYCSDPLPKRKFHDKRSHTEEIIKTNKRYKHQQKGIHWEIKSPLNDNSGFREAKYKYERIHEKIIDLLNINLLVNKEDKKQVKTICIISSKHRKYVCNFYQ